MQIYGDLFWTQIEDEMTVNGSLIDRFVNITSLNLKWVLTFYHGIKLVQSLAASKRFCENKFISNNF